MDLDKLDELAETQDVDSDSDWSEGDADAMISESGGLVQFYAKRQARQLDLLLNRYGTESQEPCDIVDINTGEIVVDCGHLRSLPEASTIIEFNGSDDETEFQPIVSEREIPLQVNLHEEICQRPNAVLDRLVAILQL